MMRPLADEARPSPEDGAALVARCALFGGLSDDGVREVAAALRWGYVPGGDALARATDGPSGVHIVHYGRVRVSHRPREGEARTEEVSVGGVVGALGVVDGELRLDAVALQDTEVAVLDRGVFEALAERHPVLWRRLSEEVGRGAAELMRGAPMPTGARHFAVMPAHRDAPVEEFVAGFARALRADATVLELDRRRFDEAVGAGSADESIDVWDHRDRRVLAGAVALSRGHDFVLYVADPGWTAWTQRCVRQCEAVLVVADARSREPIGEAPLGMLREVASAREAIRERERERRGAGDDEDEDDDEEPRTHADARGGPRLVLMHPRKTREPTNTSAWFDRLPGVRRLHHVRVDRADHYDRLARHMTGRAVGLVLGGGGARGQAHLGVLKALRRAGVHVDATGGTSAGGGIAALATLEQPFYRIKRRVRTAFVDMAPFGAYSLPFHSLMRKGAVEAPSRYLSGRRWIEDLWLPFFCVSCDIRSRRVFVHRRGRLWKALCATTALPGVLPPVVMRGKILVDGGVVDNVPVDRMRATTDGPLIVVDVAARQNDLLDKRVIDLPANASVILSHVHPFLDPLSVPNLLTVVMSTMDLADTFRERRRPDLTIQPDVSAYGLTDFDAQDELITLGYNATLDALRKASDDTLARLGTRRDRIPLTPMALPEGRRAVREARARLRRGCLHAATVLLVGLALAGVTQSLTVATLAVAASLLALLWAIVAPRLRALSARVDQP